MQRQHDAPQVAEVTAFPVLLVLYRFAIASHGAAGAAVVTSAFAVLKAVLYQALASYDNSLPQVSTSVAREKPPKE